MSDDLQLSSEHVDLRALYTQFADSADDAEHELLIALDELVDVVNAIDELIAQRA
jgi:hypothetical protein